MPMRIMRVPARRACSTCSARSSRRVGPSPPGGRDVVAEIAATSMPSCSRAVSSATRFSSLSGIWETSTTSNPVSRTRSSTGSSPCWATCSLSIMSWMPMRATGTSWGRSWPRGRRGVALRRGARPRRRGAADAPQGPWSLDARSSSHRTHPRRRPARLPSGCRRGKGCAARGAQRSRDRDADEDRSDARPPGPGARAASENSRPGGPLPGTVGG